MNCNYNVKPITQFNKIQRNNKPAKTKNHFHQIFFFINLQTQCTQL